MANNNGWLEGNFPWKIKGTSWVESNRFPCVNEMLSIAFAVSICFHKGKENALGSERAVSVDFLEAKA